MVLVAGPRRAGKTTLVRGLETGDRPYLTLDDPGQLEGARRDPVAFVRRFDSAIIDEVQRAPALLLAIKRAVDEESRPGRFILTGSSNVMLLPTVADSLAGRMETLQLFPLSQAEMRGGSGAFLEVLFAGKLPKAGAPLIGKQLIGAVLAGGYPELLARKSEARRHEWASNYLEAVLSRDLREIATIEKLTELPLFVELLARYSGQLLNYSALGVGLSISSKTSQRYVSLLERIFLTTSLRAWHGNALKRLVKTPKLHFLDTGLLATLQQLSPEALLEKNELFGPLLESFVVGEVFKLMTRGGPRVRPYHFRDAKGHEVDLVLERSSGQMIGIEVKAGATIGASDFKGLSALSAAAGKRFVAGVILYDGKEVAPFGPNLAAIPLSCLWA